MTQYPAISLKFRSSIGIFCFRYRQQLPEVSYAKAVDVWMLACLVFEAFSFLEFCFVIQYGEYLRRKIAARNAAFTAITSTNDNAHNNESQQAEDNKPHRKRFAEDIELENAGSKKTYAVAKKMSVFQPPKLRKYD